MADLPGEVTQLAQQIKAQRLIQIFVADESEPYLIQQKVLENASGYFAKAIKNEHFGGGNMCILRIPDDDKTVWQLLVCFIMQGTFPEAFDGLDSEVVQNLLIDCWILGDRYFIGEFQDLATIKLLHVFSTDIVGWEVIVYGFLNTSSGSAIRKAVSNEAMMRLYRLGGAAGTVNDEGADELDRLGRAPGAFVDILAARERFERNGHRWVGPLRGASNGDLLGKTWHDYMIEKPIASSKSTAYLTRLLQQEEDEEDE